jgi:hypothetical protein
VNFRRRALLQLASTLGFVLNKQSGKHLHLSPAEEACVHECLTYCRDGHNQVLTFFGTVFESFVGACRKLMDKFRSVIPQGDRRARIRAIPRQTRKACDAELGITLGDEACGLVVVDLAGVPLKYDQLKVFEDIIGTQAVRLELDLPGPDGRGWSRSGHSVDTAADADLGPAWRKAIQLGSRHVLEETWVPANDPHLDAKCFPTMHPYGTGSLLSEPGSGGTQRHAANRLFAAQSVFRRTPLWGFWFLDRLIKTELFFKQQRRQQAGQQDASLTDPDPITKLFGSAQPADVPESRGWWQRQQKDLMAMSSEEELGLMQCMVTITANDSAPEMLASIRRGPFAEPTAEECLEYLLDTKKRDQERPRFEHHSVEHVLSFQRRREAYKKRFFKRFEKTPLGLIKDWWDRTEAQMRAALHAHILCWFQRRHCNTRDRDLSAQNKGPYEPLPEIPRTVPGIAPRQRPAGQRVKPLRPPYYQEDNLYHDFQMGRVNAEMVRPDVSDELGGILFGGYDIEMLRIAGLARRIQRKQGP